MERARLDGTCIREHVAQRHADLPAHFGGFAIEGGAPHQRMPKPDPRSHLVDHVSFERRREVAESRLELERGQMIGIYGPSGAGKTTLLRIAAGLQAPDEGSVHVSHPEAGGAETSSRGEKSNLYIICAPPGLSFAPAEPLRCGLARPPAGDFSLGLPLAGPPARLRRQRAAMLSPSSAAAPAAAQLQRLAQMTR